MKTTERREDSPMLSITRDLHATAALRGQAQSPCDHTLVPAAPQPHDRTRRFTHRLYLDGSRLFLFATAFAIHASVEERRFQPKTPQFCHSRSCRPQDL